MKWKDISSELIQIVLTHVDAGDTDYEISRKTGLVHDIYEEYGTRTAVPDPVDPQLTPMNRKTMRTNSSTRA